MYACVCMFEYLRIFIKKNLLQPKLLKSTDKTGIVCETMKMREIVYVAVSSLTMATSIGGNA